MSWVPVGRERELAIVADLFERPDGGWAGLVLEGEPGIGKTTVLQAGVDAARRAGYRVLACRPVETEVSLAFVSLADLLDPVLDDGLPRLPAAQSRALEAALARVDPSEELGQLAVSRATLALVRELALASPLLVAIDDAQWLDASTAAILKFVLRRLADAPIRVLLTLRSGQAGRLALDRELPLQRLTVDPLSLDDLGRLIAVGMNHPLPRPRLTELHTTSGGNPFFALEIVRALALRREPLRPDDPLPVPDDIAALLRARIADLSAVAMDTLLLVAASPQPRTAAIASLVGSGPVLEEALSAGILECNGARVRFTHPLLASVVYTGATPQAQREAHKRLADAAGDPDERAAHLARASVAPDRAIAAELDAAAGRAARRGAVASAAELQGHACRLTPGERPDETFARGLRHAEYLLAAGDTGRGRTVLEQLLAGPARGPERARVALRLGQVRYRGDDVAAAHELFLAALVEAQDDPGLQAEAQQAIAFTAMLGGDIASALAHARASLAIAERLGEPRILALALTRVALNEFLAGQGFDRARLERGVELERGHLEGVPVEWLASYACAWACLMADDLPRARELYEHLSAVADERGDERFTASVLFAASELETRAGNWSRASRLAADAVQRSRESALGTVYAWSLHAQALADAHTGRVQAARDAAALGLEVAQASNAIAPLTQISATLGFLELSLGDAAAAHARLGPLAELLVSVGIAEPGVVRFMANEIEALIVLGELEQAARMLALLDQRARRLDRISARAAAARCQALLAGARGDFGRARSELGEAFRQHERLGEPFELGRTLLAQGSIERRVRQRGAARLALISALELFDGLGAALWSEKTAAELARIPGRPSSSGALSETERRVADLAVQGLANKQIAAQLFVTVRTVEAHLSKVYAKLGVRSRAELASRGRQKTVDFHD
jgi:DNA-binding CsgD family transcriptional regulator